MTVDATCVLAEELISAGRLLRGSDSVTMTTVCDACVLCNSMVCPDSSWSAWTVVPCFCSTSSSLLSSKTATTVAPSCVDASLISLMYNLRP